VLLRVAVKSRLQSVRRGVTPIIWILIHMLTHAFDPLRLTLTTALLHAALRYLVPTAISCET